MHAFGEAKYCRITLHASMRVKKQYTSKGKFTDVSVIHETIRNLAGLNSLQWKQFVIHSTFDYMVKALISANKISLGTREPYLVLI